MEFTVLPLRYLQYSSRDNETITRLGDIIRWHPELSTYLFVIAAIRQIIAVAQRSPSGGATSITTKHIKINVKHPPTHMHCV